jgi:polar amino acid transport system ATP-binding protein
VIVEVKSVTKTFLHSGPWPWSRARPIEAVRDVSLSIGPGEVVALVGQSGSGKTTLSRCILGLESVSAGAVLLEGRPWHTLPQQTAHEHVVESLVVLGGRDRRAAPAEADRMLERLGLGHRRDALPREMSGGEQRRVTLARVFALEPRLVVADEPTSGLDPDRQESVLEALIHNLPPSSACILVTHDMPQARKWCTRALVMLEGRVVEELPLPGGEPQHPYARMLFDPWGEHDLAQSTAF